MKSRSRRASRFRVLRPRLLVCVRNQGYEASLEVRKIYKAVPDGASAAAGLIRVVDESGEDYLYPRDFFAPVQVTSQLRHNLLQQA